MGDFEHDFREHMGFDFIPFDRQEKPMEVDMDVDGKVATSRAVNDIFVERMRQKTLKFEGTPADEFDTINTRNDWVAYVNAYAGRASICHRNSPKDFRAMMVKVGALAAAAIEAHDKGHC